MVNSLYLYIIILTIFSFIKICIKYVMNVYLSTIEHSNLTKTRKEKIIEELILIFLLENFILE